MSAEDRSAVLVTAANCHLCEHAHQVLGRLEREFRVPVSEIDWECPEGQRMVRADRVPFPPALYVDRRLVAYGRLSERRLRRLLAENMAR